jgi:hypothetical protein
MCQPTCMIARINFVSSVSVLSSYEALDSKLIHWSCALSSFDIRRLIIMCNYSNSSHLYTITIMQIESCLFRRFGDESRFVFDVFYQPANQLCCSVCTRSRDATMFLTFGGLPLMKSHISKPGVSFSPQAIFPRYLENGLT